jgi:hypothetical protein
MKKAILILLFVVLVALAVAAPVAAGEGAWDFQFQGDFDCPGKPGNTQCWPPPNWCGPNGNTPCDDGGPSP